MVDYNVLRRFSSLPAFVLLSLARILRSLEACCGSVTGVKELMK